MSLRFGLIKPHSRHGKTEEIQENQVEWDQRVSMLSTEFLGEIDLLLSRTWKATVFPNLVKEWG